MRHDVGIDLGRVGVVGVVGALEGGNIVEAEGPREHREDFEQALLLVVQ